ncbi:acyl-phosphate glycerol-3-phosphate acyltransferase [Caloranaerobacter azorensis DSM 13643]|uniref:Glycerol-3-phosphate acyltransferase n=1 Tax=Caloranaerobacter azorensis DSM 13643 TaxID=1121264 RepID=A0A1M5V3F0_9FIRM|nr:glycerol-3-phosphate 1-O-acyltransferase PlsY [Caloranaerobacter azorensis]SHH69483.1 acyl-phosphate glycerol-3-phosphate acyltransferase [Caloranaerobacter azorensis DSM 13643]
MYKILLVLLLSYLIGNINAAYLIGRILENKDIRNYGSGNAGATNALRVFGAKIAAVTFLFDLLKAVIAVILGKMILGETGMFLAGISVIVGHNWPALLNFRGGKGIASTIGVMLIINYKITLICLAIGLIIVIKSRYVSLGSVITMALLPIIGLFFNRPFNLDFLIFTLILSAMAIYRHKGNISRLLKGQERKIGQRV